MKNICDVKNLPSANTCKFFEIKVGQVNKRNFQIFLGLAELYTFYQQSSISRKIHLIRQVLRWIFKTYFSNSYRLLYKKVSPTIFILFLSPITWGTLISQIYVDILGTFCIEDVFAVKEITVEVTEKNCGKDS